MVHCSTVPDMTVLWVSVLYLCFNYHELTSAKSTRAASEDLWKCICCSAVWVLRKLAGTQCTGEEAQVLHRFSVSWRSHLFSLCPLSSHVACQFVKHTASRKVLSSIYLDGMIWSRDLFHCVSWKPSWNPDSILQMSKHSQCTAPRGWHHSR